MDFRVAELLRASALCLGVAMPVAAMAQAPQPSAQAAGETADPIVAKVGDQAIHLSDLKSAVSALPANLRTLPDQVLYPMLLDRLIDQEALVAEAKRTGLDKQPDVMREVKLAETMTLGNAMLSKEVSPQVTDAAVKARYEKDIAGKPGEEEVHAKHILVDSEQQAKDIIAQLKAGGNFDELAKKYSKDPGAADGGDLGFFKKEQMVPEFANAAFSLKPGEVSPQPVHTQFGWHVIKVIERRQDKPPSFEEAKADLRQKMAQEAAEKAVTDAKAGVKIEKFNLDGTPVKATDTAVPPPPSK